MLEINARTVICRDDEDHIRPQVGRRNKNSPVGTQFSMFLTMTSQAPSMAQNYYQIGKPETPHAESPALLPSSPVIPCFGAGSLVRISEVLTWYPIKYITEARFQHFSWVILGFLLCYVSSRPPILYLDWLDIIDQH
jgi:hypothetical protein